GVCYRGEFGKGLVVDDALDGFLDGDPHVAQPGGGAVVGRGGGGQAPHRGQRAADGPHDVADRDLFGGGGGGGAAAACPRAVADGDLCGGAGQGVPAVDSAVAVQQPGAAQVEQDALEKAERD